MLEAKCSQQVNGVTEEITDHGDVDTPVTWAREISEDRLNQHKKGSGCDRKNADVPKEVTQAKKGHVKGVLRESSQGKLPRT